MNGGDKRDNVPAYLPPWPDWSKLPANAEKTPARRRRPVGRLAAGAAAALAAALLWRVDPLVTLAFLLGLMPIIRRTNPRSRRDHERRDHDRPNH